MEKCLRNVLHLGVAFMMFRFAFETMGSTFKLITESIQQDVTSFRGEAYYSQSILYGSYSIFSWIAPSVISLIGCSWSMFLGTVIYIVFIVQFIIPNDWCFYSLSYGLGFAIAIIWTGQGTYLTMNSSKETMTRNVGIFFGLSDLSMIFGNIFVTFIFDGKEAIDEETRNCMMLTFVVVGGVALLLFLLLPAPSTKEEDEAVSEGPVQVFLGVVQLFFNKSMLLLLPCFIYEGLTVAFFSGVYSTCIGFTKNLENRKRLVGVSGILMGIGEIIGDVVVGLFGHKINKKHLVGIGCLVHLVCFFLIFLNLSNDSTFGDTEKDGFIKSNLYVAIFCSFLLGFGDSLYSNTLNSYLGIVYVKNCSSAFAIFQFFVAIGSVITLLLGQLLGLFYQLAMLLLVGMLAFGCFLIVESTSRQSKNYSKQGIIK